MSFSLKSNIPQLTADLKQRAAALVVRTAGRIETTAKLSFADSKSGRTYKRGKKTHIASAPGEAPAVDYGQLTNSVQWELSAELSAVVGTNVEHGMHLEFGASRTEPRPWLGPAFDEAAESFEKGMKELLK